LTFAFQVFGQQRVWQHGCKMFVQSWYWPLLLLLLLESCPAADLIAL
jgi:hypothetical protein